MSFFFASGIRRILTAGLSLVAFLIPPAMALEVGGQAPDFSLSASDGKTYTLAQFRGRQPVVIAFFPKAFTGG